MRNSRFKQFLLHAGTLGIVLVCAGVNAQPEVSPDSTSPREIVVTATKTGAVPLQDVPASISVVDAEQIHAEGIQNLEDIERQTPGLNLTRNGLWTRLYLRGIGTNLDFTGSDPSVTVHVDGVYEGRTSTVLDDFLDVKRVEILRGPQGTLYGRNSTGGTINIITRLPDAQPKSKVSVGVGNYSQYRVQASASGGLGSDRVIGGINLMQTEHDPYIRNINGNGNKGLDDDNTSAASSNLQWLPNNDVKLILRADYSDSHHAPMAYKTTGLTVDGKAAPLAAASSTPSDPFTINNDLVNPFVAKRVQGISAELAWTLSPQWDLTSLSAYRKLDIGAREDTDGSNLNVLVTELYEQQHQASEELRVSYRGPQLDWVSGVFLLQEHHDSDTTININLTGSKNHYLASNITTASALFSQGTYHLTPRLSAVLGLRYSREQKDFDNINTVRNAANIQVGGFTVNDDGNWNDWSPKLALDYTIDANTMIYASASRGFKSGGFNLTSSDAEFGPEKVWTYETGAKLHWLARAVRSHVALFHSDYRDLQVSDFTQPGVLSISNAATATIDGLELENQWVISSAWMLALDYAWLDATYTRYLAPRGNSLVDVSGNRLNASPRHKVSTWVQYYLPARIGDWSFRLEYNWRSRQYFTAFNEPVSSQGAYGLVNGQIALTAPDGRWDLQFFGNNLTNIDYSTSSREFPAALTGVTRDINPPRTLGTRVTYRFQ